MRLLELDPRWLIEGGRKVGFVFKCPTDPKWWQTCFFEAGRKLMCCTLEVCQNNRDDANCPHSQLGLVAAADVDPSWVQGCTASCAWGHGDLDFATLTVTPSLDGSAGGLWHGFITNGEIVGGL
jgi:hypothetical protein